MSDHNDLRQKIDEAKRRLPMPDLLSRLGLGEHAKKSARCPFHSDEHNSFSVFKKKDGAWWHRCFVGCSEGDEIWFLRKLKGLSATKAVNLYLEMAGFPASRPSKPHEYPNCPAFPMSFEYPVSNGQWLNKLKALAAANRCTERGTAKKRFWKLMRDLKAIEKGIGCELQIGERMTAFDEWYRLSQSFLDAERTRDDYLAEFLAGLGKVRVPTGEGDTLNKALGAVGKLSASEVPMIPGMPKAPESWRRVAGLHREISRLCGNKTYFLTCRDAAKASPCLSYQTAYNINLALASPQFGVIKIVRVGDHRPKGKASKLKATEFKYLLSETKNGAPQTQT